MSRSRTIIIQIVTRQLILNRCQAKIFVIRMPVWVNIPMSKITPVALENRNKI